MAKHSKSSEEEGYRRVNLLIRSDQHEKVLEKGLSLSGLVRNLLDDHFSETKIVLALSKSGKEMYDSLVANYGITDHEIEPHLVRGLDQLLQERTGRINAIRQRLKKLSKE